MFTSPIIIVGVQRSGTSFVAETLIKNFGVRFGYESFHTHPRLGLTYEDTRLVGLNQQYTHDEISEVEYRRGMKCFFKQMVGGKGLWGFKDPRLLLGLKWVVDYFYPDCTIIRTYRPIELIAKSLIEKANWPNTIETKWIIGEQLKIIDDALSDKKCISVEYSNKRMSELELLTILTGGRNLKPLIQKEIEALSGRQ